MLLALTNSTDATADNLLSRLDGAGISYLRLDTDSMLDRSALSYRPGKPRLRFDGTWYVPSDFSTVWYRRPERLVSDAVPNTPEGQCVLDEWSEALEGFFAHIHPNRWMNFPAANALASRKLEQLTTAEENGFLVPETLVTQDPAALREFFNRHHGKVIVKPLGKAYIERPDTDADSLVFTNQVSSTDLDDLSDLPRCPTLFQQAVQKASDVRITVVDSEIHAVDLTASDEDGQQRCDIRRNNMADVRYRNINLPDSVAECVQKLVSFYGLRFAAVDMAVAQDGQWYFFEVNPNGQWAWLDLCGGTAIFRSFLSAFIKDQA